MKIFLMGFGRIGRNIYRLGFDNSNFDFVGISDLGKPDTLCYLLQNDSLHGKFNHKVQCSGSNMDVDGKSLEIYPGSKPSEIPWEKIDADIVIDSTGVSWDENELKYYQSNAKLTVITSNSNYDFDRIVIPGINDDSISKQDTFISPSSSTTQALALMLNILDSGFGIQNSMMTTVHAYTADQPLADDTKFRTRRSRSAVENIIPNNSESPKIIEKVLPKFKGKIAGIALNVPTPNGSCVDLTSELERIPKIEEVNELFRSASESSHKNIIGYTEDPIVSTDAVGILETMVFDSKATMIASNHFLKTICWYDNGWGFSKRILEIISAYNNLGGKF